MLRLIEKLNEQNKNVAALLIPAITLGCVEFKEIDQDGNFVFERTRKDFEPREVDQPLRYALHFVLKRFDESRSVWDRLYRWWYGLDKAFLADLSKFAAHRKPDYKKYGGPHLL